MIKLISEEFEIVRVEERDESLFVEVEFVDRSRKGFGFPLEARFLVEDSDGVPFFVRRVQESVSVLLERKKAKESLVSLDLDKIRNCKFKAGKVKEDKKLCKLGRNALKALRECPERLAVSDDFVLKENGFNDDDVKVLKEKGLKKKTEVVLKEKSKNDLKNKG